MENVATQETESHEDEAQHPIGVYLKVWILLFVISGLSYAVDYFDLQGMVRWSLIIIFMLLKAGLIIAVFHACHVGAHGAYYRDPGATPAVDYSYRFYGFRRSVCIRQSG